MKMLVSAIAVLAVVNMLAVFGLVGFLAATDRLDSRRVNEMRDMFVETVSERDAREEAEEAAAEQKQREAEERAKEAEAPIPAADILASRLEHTQADVVRIEAIRREVEILQETLRRERAALDDERATFEREREQFEAARRQVMQTEGNAQFRRALATYEGLKPDRARIALAQLIERGEIEQVVDYLNAMQDRNRTRIIDEFLEDEPDVATELLERLRMRGTGQQALREPENS